MSNSYPTYRTSGLDWLGQIPSHWECVKIKHVASCNDDVLSESTDGSEVIEYVEISDVSYEHGIQGCSKILFKDAPSRARRITKNGDIIISTVRTYLKAIARIGHSTPIVSTGFAVIRPVRTNPCFLYYVLSESGFLDTVQLYSTGVSYPAITANDLINLKCPLPPLAEQEAIAGYLDEATEKIDRLVAEKRSQVEDLRRYRTSLISETVTRGLNPDAPLRPSGIDWLGNIPKHWEAVKMKYCVEISNGSDPKTEGDIPVYGSGATSFKTCGEYKEGPTVLIGRKGATLHIPHWIEGKYWNVDTAFDTRVKGNYDLRYFYYIAFIFDYNQYKSQTTLPSMTQSAYENAIIPLPPLSEQEEIAEFLDAKTGKIDALIGELEGELDDLAAYRKSVISEAVTGKVDVRDWKPQN